MIKIIIYCLLGYAAYYIIARSIFLTYGYIKENYYRFIWLFTLPKKERVARLKHIRTLQAMRIE